MSYILNYLVVFILRLLSVYRHRTALIVRETGHVGGIRYLERSEKNEAKRRGVTQTSRLATFVFKNSMISWFWKRGIFRRVILPFREVTKR